VRSEDMHTLPVATYHRGVAVYVQSAERIERAKLEIDQVVALSSPGLLYTWACDARIALKVGSWRPINVLLRRRGANANGGLSIPHSSSVA
jgi:hypothetical protein